MQASNHLDPALVWSSTDHLIMSGSKLLCWSTGKNTGKKSNPGSPELITHGLEKQGRWRILCSDWWKWRGDEKKTAGRLIWQGAACHKRVMTESKESALMKKNERFRRLQIRRTGAMRSPSESDSDVRSWDERFKRFLSWPNINGKFVFWQLVHMKMVVLVTEKKMLDVAKGGKTLMSACTWLLYRFL